MYLFEVKVVNIGCMEDREVASSSMIADLTDLKDKGSVMEIMERMGNILIEFNGEKKGEK